MLATAGCGGSTRSIVLGRDHLQVTSLTLTPTTGFPGDPSDVLVVRGGARLAALAHLLPRLLPAPTTHVVARGLTVCFPMDLTIGLSNGQRLTYTSCDRPHPLLRLLAAMCPMLRKPGFCRSYRNTL